MSITALTIKDLFQNMSNAVMSSLGDMYDTPVHDHSSDGDTSDQEQDKTIHVLMKENRYMYIALLFILLLIVGNVLFSEND